MQLVVLAAGIGSRFGGLKQLAPVGPHGEAIVDALIERARPAGFDRVLVVVRPEIERTIADHFESLPPALPTAFVVQTVPPSRDRPLGTAEAVLRCRDDIDGAFVVVNADDLYPAVAFQTIGQHLASIDEHAVVGFRLRNTIISDRPVSRAVLTFDEITGRLLSIEERRAIEPAVVTGDPWVSMNMWGLQTSMFDVLDAAVDHFVATGSNGEVLLPDVVAEQVKVGLFVRVLPCEEPCIGVTYADDVATVRAALA